MLGLRIFQNTQIDLWQGLLSDFFVSKSEPSSKAESPLEWASLHQDCVANSYRHLAIVPTDLASLELCLKSLHTYLQANSTDQRILNFDPMTRITVLCQNKETYDDAQSLLFQLFPESSI
jgi:hypothetical protein